MRILYLSQLVPHPPNAGPKVRSYHVLEYLVQAGHEVTLVAFHRDDDSDASLAHLSRLCHAVHTLPMRRSRLADVRHLLASTLTGEPFLIRRDGVAAMYDYLRRLLAAHTYDAIHADQLWMAQYALYAAQEAGHAPRLVLDQHNAVFLIPRRMAVNSGNPLLRLLLRGEERRLARYEVETCRRFDHVVWVTAEDQRAVAAVAPNGGEPLDARSQHNVIPICVDTTTKPVIARRPDAHRITFLGGLHWPPNAEGVRWLADAVWPSIAAQTPNAVLTIIGKSPPRGLPDGPNIEVTGYVDDPVPYLAETAVFVVPLHAGGGMRVKIVDAWSWQMPIVSTTIGAEGIAVDDGDNICLADTAEAFGAAVLALLRDRAAADALARAGRETVEKRYDWRPRYREWEAVYG